jgi:hypothetical protein
MDVDTNTPRNGLHFFGYIIIFAALFGRRLYIANSGNVSIDVRPIGADPTFFFL